ncbi:hypothetical protein [Frankia sp. AgW1.1]|uniref:hypothetical protein n=1 Tax=Frankia sp. AgW1.1 TaxID=1836971 RepID=UPI00193371DD|nr:hypothetical protein [Frankia sp. AgW1.1]MBL7487108.1 hypothetical protein [Frankia sp. AgW1.1]
MLVLEEIAIWLGNTQDHRCKSTYRLLQREGIEPAIRGHQRAPSQWRWSDLAPIAHLAKGPLSSELDAA